MRISSNWKDFKEKFNVMTSREDGIIELDLEFDEDK